MASSYEMKSQSQAKGTVPTRESYPARPPGLDEYKANSAKNKSSTSITEIEGVYSRFQRDMDDYRNSRYIAPASESSRSPNPSHDDKKDQHKDNYEEGEDTVDPKTPLVGVHTVEASSSTSLPRTSRSLKNKEKGKPNRMDSADTGDTGYTEDGTLASTQPPKAEFDQEYRLYKRRWVGVIALVLLNIVKGCNWVWFGSIANSMTTTFGFTLGQVNMFGNIPHISYIVFSWCVPLLVRRWGLRWSSVFGATVLLISAWLRVCGTIKTLPVNASYALMLIAQLGVGVTAPCFQVVGPKYAEVWFDLKGRQTTTMIVAISDPLGTAVGQIVAPLIGNLRFGIFVLALATTISFPLAFLVLPSPPKPPTYSGSLISPPFTQTMRAAFGFARAGEQYLTPTERLDFFILFFVFGVLIAGTSSFSVFIAQIFQPYGYSAITSGLMGGIFLISGLVAAILSAPLFDRVFSYHLARTVKVVLPILGACWIGLIFAVKPNNLAGIYVVLVAIASFSFILLPVGLELGVEITRNAETSTAVLWSGGNAISFIWVVVMNALRAPDSAHPPKNMRRALIFNASFICATATLGFIFTGKQTRREMDEVMAKRNQESRMGIPS